MSKDGPVGYLFDPEHRVKRPPYGQCKPSGQIFTTVLGIPDNEYVDEKFIASTKLGAAVGFNHGLFTTVLREQQKMYARDKLMYYTGRCAQSTLRGGVVGALYALIVTGSCKVRGNVDDPFNHFFGGFGISSLRLVRGDIHGFLVHGLILGGLAAIFKSLYMGDFEFIKRTEGPHVLTNCRYPELYLFRARAPPENLPRETD